MGLIEAVFGGRADVEADTDADDSEQYAILLNAGPENAATAANAFNYAVELDDGGYEVQLFLDGTAAKWPAEFAETPERPFSHDWRKVRSRGLLVGACGYCANAFDAADACEMAGVRLLSGQGEHAPSVAQLAEEGYEILTIG